MTKKEFDIQPVGKGDKISVHFQTGYLKVTGVDWQRRVYFSGDYETSYEMVKKYIPNPKFITE